MRDDLVVVVYRDKKYLKKLEPGKSFHGKGGILPFESVIGCPWGTRFGEYEVFRPAIEDIMMYGVRRETQIVFPKDAFFISVKLDIRAGSRVLEIGTGSGALTLLLSRAVGPEGQVVSIEKEERHYKNAQKNLAKYLEFRNTELLNIDVLDFDGEGVRRRIRRRARAVALYGGDTDVPEGWGDCRLYRADRKPGVRLASGAQAGFWRRGGHGNPLQAVQDRGGAPAARGPHGRSHGLSAVRKENRADQRNG